MDRITYKEMKELIKIFNNKNVSVEVTGIITQTLNIQKLKIYFKKNIIVIKDNRLEKLKINLCWIANFYTNKENTIIRYEFDQTGAVELHII